MSSISLYPSARPRSTRRPTRWSCTSERVTCRRCNHVWEDGDPAYRIACRGCDAAIGSPCRRPRGGNERVCHQRDTDALRQGLFEPCEGLSWDGRHDKPLPLYGGPVARACPVITGSPVNAEPGGIPAGASTDGRKQSPQIEKPWAA
ncbi:hypothetical protein HLH33_16680 [Gluconacetobacter diazotrophicus]|uniref:Uncharacterized protein n=1 Tax=Gluconacetobacter diazotrophicus TaxID=33996 RepID=A0A7W4NHM5_GLUDI|nr:hypothetical protein [Gluconacetobacter diazotrophicus]MBB2157916.1 hypothetical protein [Gluconacetobacter diazotrophicus]